MSPLTPTTRAPAFTLVELVLSLAVMSVLLGGMASVVLLASHALPNTDSADIDADAAQTALQMMLADLPTATALLVADPNAVEFTVPDRGHGSPGPELIRYEWSGSADDPLTRTYNSGIPATICQSVTGLRLTYLRRIGTLLGPPKVLLVTDNPPSTRVLAKRDLIESWGFSTEMIAAAVSTEELNAACDRADVVYMTYELVNDFLELISKLGDGTDANGARGYVVECPLTYSSFGLASFYQILDSSADTITITDNTHPITNGFALGDLQICASAQPLVQANGTYAPGLQWLAERSSKPSLAVAEFGAEVLNGHAAARRVKLPWARSGMNIENLNDDGRAILRRSLVWAAAPVCFSEVVIELTVGDVTVRGRAPLLNTPQENRP